jgi:hypothetical protein
MLNAKNEAEIAMYRPRAKKKKWLGPNRKKIKNKKLP